MTIQQCIKCNFRLCEELEYSDMLDRAAVTKDKVERMTLVAAFAVSSYASAANAARAAHKPFNPLLGKSIQHTFDISVFDILCEH